MRTFVKSAVIGLSVLSCSILGGFTVDTNKLSITQQTAQANEHPFSIEAVIMWLNATQYDPPMNIIYPYPGFEFVNNDETEFNQLVFDDERIPGGYPWANFYGMGDDAWVWYQAILAEQAEAQLYIDVAALNASTVNGHSLPGTLVVTKSDVGLGNVDNTSDANKPISTATQTALDGKAEETHGHFAADIADATTVGIDVLTAEDAEAARTALGVDTELDDKASKASFAALDSLAAHGVSTAATNADASFSGASVDILGISVPTNTSYGNLVSAYNDLAGKYNDLGAKFNTILTWLGTNRTAINNLKAAGAL